jgi:hypothetical protein
MGCCIAVNSCLQVKPGDYRGAAESQGPAKSDAKLGGRPDRKNWLGQAPIVSPVAAPLRPKVGQSSG